MGARGLAHPCISISMLQKTLRRCAGSAENAENAENATFPRKNAEKLVCVMPCACVPRPGYPENSENEENATFSSNSAEKCS